MWVTGRNSYSNTQQKSKWRSRMFFFLLFQMILISQCIGCLSFYSQLLIQMYTPAIWTGWECESHGADALCNILTRMFFACHSELQMNKHVANKHFKGLPLPLSVNQSRAKHYREQPAPFDLWLWSRALISAAAAGVILCWGKDPNAERQRSTESELFIKQIKVQNIKQAGRQQHNATRNTNMHILDTHIL